MNVTPIRDRILVKPVPAETKTASGLFIPDNATDSPDRGTVIRIGAGRITDDGTVIPMTVAEGNTVMYTKGAGQPVKVDNEDHVILTENQILAIVE